MLNSPVGNSCQGCERNGESCTADWSPCEYVLQVKYEGTGLPEGAAKHLLPIKEDAVRDNLATILTKHKDVCPAELPKALPPLRGLGDEHHIKLVPGVKLVAKSPYQQAPA